MESITFRCENAACKKTLRVKEDLVGKRVKCPKCGHKMPVPAQELAAEAEPARARPSKAEPAQPIAARAVAPQAGPTAAQPVPLKKVPEKPAPAKPFAPAQPVAEASAKGPARFKATRQSYGLFCPKCGGLLLPPQMELKGIVCHHCGVQIEFA